MKGDHLEELFKRGLKKRQIQPSQAAWHRLDQQLEADKKKTRKQYWWISGVAASFVLGLLLAGWLIKTPVSSHKLVNQPALNHQEIIPVDLQHTKMPVKSDLNFTKQLLTKEVARAKHTLAPAENQHTISFGQHENLEETDTSTSLKDDKNQSIAVADSSGINKTIVQVTDREIDQLLRTAQFEVRGERIFNVTDTQISAYALLNSIEINQENQVDPDLLLQMAENNAKVEKKSSPDQYVVEFVKQTFLRAKKHVVENFKN